MFLVRKAKEKVYFLCEITGFAPENSAPKLAKRSATMRKENLKRKGVDDGDNSGEENEDTTLPAGEEGGAAVDVAGEDSADAGADSPSQDGAKDEEDQAAAPETATEENGDSKEATSDNEQFEDAETGDKVAKTNGGDQESTEEEIIGEGDKKVSRGRGKPPKKAITQEAANGDGDADKEKENGGGKTSDDEEAEGEDEEEAEGKDDDDSDYGSSKPKKAKKVAAGKRGAKKKVGRKPAAANAKGRPGRKPKKQESEDEEDEEEEYEVQDIIDHRKERGGKILYRIRWKNYGAADDTWEPEATLSCPDIIKRYKAKCEKEDEAPPAKKGKTPTKAGGKKGGPGRKPAAAGRGRGRPGAKKATYEKDDDEGDDDEETEQEYEVERIIDVHFKRNGTREYLVRWKGFGAKDDTWEPADNLSCPDLIEKFNEKLDKTKSTGAKELRVNRKHTERLTLVEKGRKTSRRNANKGRVSYYDGE